MDFVGRYLTTVLNFLLIKESTLAWLLAVRTSLVVTFILSMKYNSTVILSDNWFHILQMAILALSQGWLNTVAVIHLPAHVEGGAAKSRACTLGLSVAFLGIVSGQWSSKLIKVLWG